MPVTPRLARAKNPSALVAVTDIAKHKHLGLHARR
jgi:hypothetical protein